VLVRVGWADLEPAPGAFEWGLIDRQIMLAETYGMRVSLAVVSGPQAPGWLEGMGVPMFDYTLGENSERIPLPWNETLLTRWESLIVQLGARYAGEETISLVYATNSSTNGFEMQLPRSPADRVNWEAAGYTDALYAGSWERSFDAFASAFPDHPISHEVHPVLDSVLVAEQVREHALTTYGDRAGVLAAWWMVHNAQNVYPDMYEILLEAPSEGGHTQVQVANSYSRRPERFGEEGIAAEIDLALASGVRYMEIWNADLLDEDLTALMESASARLNAPVADLNGDGFVGAGDLAALLAAWGACDGACAADFDGDGAVGSSDLAVLLAAWG